MTDTMTTFFTSMQNTDQGHFLAGTVACASFLWWWHSFFFRGDPTVM